MYVVDASVWVSRLIPADKHHDQSHRWLGTVLRARVRLFAPVILLAEVAGAVARRTGREERGLRAIENIVEIEDIRLVTLDPEMTMRSARVAAGLYLRGADATYVALAQETGYPLVTWDSQQAERAKGSVQTLTPADLTSNQETE